MSGYKINKENISKCSIYILFLLMLCSMEPWFFWHYKAYAMLLLSFLFLILRIVNLTESKIGFSKFIAVFIGFILFVYLGFHDLSNLIYSFNYIRLFIIALFVIMMTNDEMLKLTTVTTNIYAWIVGISIGFHILVVFCNAELPYFTIQYPSTLSEYPDFKNYIFLILIDTPSVFYRLSSIFTEPGHLGMISAILLYINKYDLKKKSVLIIFIGLILSFSLAAYVLLILGYIIYEFSKGKRLVKKISKLLLGLTVLIPISVYIYKEYDESAVARLIIARMEYDDKRGIVGNNRNSEHFDYYYEKKFLNDANYWITGVGINYFQTKLAGKTSSYKVFFVMHGLIGLILLLLFYLSIFYTSRSWFICGLLLLYCASFWQRPYALWEMQLFLFISAASVFQNKRLPSAISKTH